MLEMPALIAFLTALNCTSKSDAGVLSATADQLTGRALERRTAIPILWEHRILARLAYGKIFRHPADIFMQQLYFLQEPTKALCLASMVIRSFSPFPSRIVSW